MKADGKNNEPCAKINRIERNTKQFKEPMVLTVDYVRNQKDCQT